MRIQQSHTRRGFLTAAAAGGAIALTTFSRAGSLFAAAATASAPAEEITPAEDLMFEHGLIERLLLIYDAAATRRTASADDHNAIIQRAAEILQRFAGEYHERMEENYVFPRFEKAGLELELVKTLRAQHDAGRTLTTKIIDTAKGKDGARQKQLPLMMHTFVDMYFPHISRENSVICRQFRSLLPAKEYDQLGDKFEDLEDQKLGAEGFEETLAQVEEIEQQLNIYDIARLTPRV